MYDYLVGKVSNISPKGITLEVSGIGYLLLVANPFDFVKEKNMKIYIKQIVKEDELSLYGFVDELTRDLFIDLISVKGIGPKSALAITGAGSVSEIKSSIISEDLVYLQKFPKIGKKSASQIILDLKSKFEKDGTKILELNTNDSQVIEALVTLGYSNKEIIKNLVNVDKNLSIEEKIKKILISMTK